MGYAYVLKDKVGNILNPIIPRYERLTKYSTTEIKTGKKWVDGKDIYSKRVTIKNPQAIPAGGVTDRNFPHGISDVDTITDIINPLFKSPTYTFNIPVVSVNGEMTFILNISSANVVVRSYKIAWGTEWSLECTLEYTKK